MDGQYGYGGRPNPFDQRDGGNGGYGAPMGRAPPPAAFGQGPRPGGGGAARYNQAPAMGRDDYGSSNVEMASLAQNASSFGQGGDPNGILNECQGINQGIDRIDQNLNQLKMLQDRSLNDADTSAGSSTSRQLENLSSETMSMYRSLTERVRMVKSNPESQQPKNAPQVGRTDRRLKQAIQSYQQVESAFRQKTKDQMARQYRIVRPDADDAEVRAAVEDTTGGQVFQQALMQSGRQGQARAVLSAVQDRHAALQKIEQQMIELSQLFQDMDTLIIQQEVQVAQIEQKGEEVVENLGKGNEEIAVAVTTARSTRKKKWICLGICVAIVLVIVIIIVVYMQITKGASGGKKRSIRSTALDNLQMNNVGVRSVQFAGERPISRVYAQSKIVVPNQDFQQDVPSEPLSRFVGGGRANIATLKERMVKAGEAFDESTAMKPSKRVVIWDQNDVQPPPSD
ncbi:t-SNARE [Thozetella sp. PMI_491]|nr:t-SNARE [Thozetella sp. PMI_491]